MSVSHAVVIARVITNSVDRGTHSFIVPVRSLKTWQALPGIELGDIGVKMGLNTTDNGYAVFKDVRIPRTNMLMGLAQVNRDGTYTKQENAHPKAAYGTMLLVRQQIVNVVAFQLAQAVTIATRYSTVRTQGHGHYSESPVEVSLMSFKSQHARLLGLNAQAYAILFASKACTKVHEDNEAIAYIHAITSSLKAYATQTAAEGAEDARKCCGGQGYAVLSGLPDILALVTPQCTWEGDNMVLYQQTARYLMNTVDMIKNGKHGDTHQSFAYLVEAILFPDSAFPNSFSAEGISSLDHSTLLGIFQYRAARLIIGAADAMTTSTNDERRRLGRREAWNENMLLLIAAARSHAEVFVLEAYIIHVGQIVDPAVKKAMEKNVTLYALTTILACPSFFEDGYLAHEQSKTMRGLVNELHGKLLPDAIALTDAWGFSDASLKSAIGVKDGNVYETLMAWTRQLPINQKLGGADGVEMTVFESDIRAMIKTKSKL